MIHKNIFILFSLKYTGFFFKLVYDASVVHFYFKYFFTVAGLVIKTDAFYQFFHVSPGANRVRFEIIAISNVHAPASIFKIKTNGHFCVIHGLVFVVFSVQSSLLLLDVRQPHPEFRFGFPFRKSFFRFLLNI